MRRKENIPTAQKTSFDVSWAFFFVCLAPPLCFLFVPPLRCHSISGGGGAVVLPLSRRFGHLFPPHEQLLGAVVLMGRGGCVGRRGFGQRR
jgi:hypothetical protein